MKRLVFIVEGATEIKFVNDLIIPYLYSQGKSNPMSAQKITTNRKKNISGGVTSYGLFKNEINLVFSQGNVMVTTLIDFYGLPTDFPNYTMNSININQIEHGISMDFGNNPDLIPYIQRHELEALYFNDENNFSDFYVKPIQKQSIQQIISNYKSPEDINNSKQTAPSKRLENILNYKKISDSTSIIPKLDIDDIRSKCPRFNAWIQKLITTLT